MKKFDIITESDARVLARGETVMLARRGHITPLAQDTLTRATRHGASPRIRVSVDDASLAPRGGHPHDRDRQRPHRRGAAKGAGHVSAGPRPGGERPRAPTAPIRWTIRMWRRSVARPVARGEADAGIVIDGAGIGSAIAANKMPGHSGGDGDHGDDRAVFARAQRRERADARRDAGHARTKRAPS